MFDKPSKKFGVYQGYEAVKHGFSWPAFFFGPWWALSCRLWVYAILLVLAHVAIVVTTEMLEGKGIGIIVGVLWLGLIVLVGIKGNDWRRTRLLKKGYRSVKIVDAETSAAATKLSQINYQ